MVTALLEGLRILPHHCLVTVGEKDPFLPVRSPPAYSFNPVIRCNMVRVVITKLTLTGYCSVIICNPRFLLSLSLPDAKHTLAYRCVCVSNEDWLS